MRTLASFAFALLTLAFSACSQRSIGDVDLAAPDEDFSTWERPREGTDVRAWERGRALFLKRWTAAEGLGPDYNAPSCADCHHTPTAGGSGDRDTEVALYALHPAGQDVVLRYHLGAKVDFPPGASYRIGPPLYGVGVLESKEIRCTTGHPAANGGRFGWRPYVATIREFISFDALGAELGMTSTEAGPDVLSDLVTYVTGLAPPPVHAEVLGKSLFVAAGCAACHAEEAGTDLCVHHMGSDLDDGITLTEPPSSSDEWGTPALWGLRARRRFLHDGRCEDASCAIRNHGGDAADSRAFVDALSEFDKRDLLDYLGSL